MVKFLKKKGGGGLLYCNICTCANEIFVLFVVVVIVDIFYFHATVSQIIYFLYTMVKSESAMTIVVIIKNKLFNGNII